MNEIRNTNITFTPASLGQIQQLSQSQSTHQAEELETMLNRTLGASSSSSTAAPELSLDTIMSGTLNGYLGLGDVAMEGLDSPIASTQVLNSSYTVASTDKQMLAATNEEGGTLASLPVKLESTIAFDNKINETAMAMVPGSVMPKFHAIQIAHVDMPDDSVGIRTIQIPSQRVALDTLKPNETVAMTSNEIENTAISLPSETLAAWDSPKDFALTDKSGESVALSLDVPENLSAVALEKGQTFDSQTLAAIPVVEGNKSSYNTAWNGISENLSAYAEGENQGVVGFADFETPNGLNNTALGLNLDTGLNLGLNENQLEHTTLASNAMSMPSELLGYRSFVDKELLGFIDLSSFSSIVGYDVNPTSSSAALRPEKYISNLILGYNA